MIAVIRVPRLYHVPGSGTITRLQLYASTLIIRSAFSSPSVRGCSVAHIRRSPPRTSTGSLMPYAVLPGKTVSREVALKSSGRLACSLSIRKINIVIVDESTGRTDPVTGSVRGVQHRLAVLPPRQHDSASLQDSLPARPPLPPPADPAPRIPVPELRSQPAPRTDLPRISSGRLVKCPSLAAAPVAELAGRLYP